MIEISKLNTSFKQNHGSCVLASYAIVSNYFTGIPIERFFEDYCKHFGESFRSWQEAEYKYASHFDREWRARDCRGYEVILDLHRSSNQQVFIQSREIFSGEFYLNSSQIATCLQGHLQKEEAFLNITYEPGINYHSITIFYDGKCFHGRDTNTTQLNEIKILTDIGTLRDGVLYKKISKKFL